MTNSLESASGKVQSKGRIALRKQALWAYWGQARTASLKWVVIRPRGEGCDYSARRVGGYGGSVRSPGRAEPKGCLRPESQSPCFTIKSSRCLCSLRQTPRRHPRLPWEAQVRVRNNRGEEASLPPWAWMTSEISGV